MSTRLQQLPPEGGKRSVLEPVERPILFSAPMVIATLRGRKTQTRRTRGLERFNDRGRFIRMERDHRGVWCAVFGDSIPDDPCPIYVPSPYGGTGDRLWVRETWGLPPRYDPKEHGDLKTKPRLGPVCFAADFSGRHAWNGGKWRPSIHMPRWASRITLEVTGVRVERLQAISTKEALGEGVELCCGCPSLEAHVRAHQGSAPLFRNYLDATASFGTPTPSFRSLWESINGFESWDANPWVWVVEFRRVTP